MRKLGVEEWLLRGVMTTYDNESTVVKTKHGNSEEFMVKVGLHLGSVLSPLPLVVVMEALTLSWKLLYVDDLVLVADNMGGVEREDIGMES